MVRNHVGEPVHFSRSSVAEQRLGKAQVGARELGSRSQRSNGTCNAQSALRIPTRGYRFFQLGVAQMAARVIWDHEAAGSRPATETNFTLYTNPLKQP